MLFLLHLITSTEFPNYPKYCLSEIESAPFISDNRGSTVYTRFNAHSNSPTKVLQLYPLLSLYVYMRVVFIYLRVFTQYDHKPHVRYYNTHVVY